MSEEFKIALPKLGESIVSATIVQWFKKEGDEVQLDEPLLEVSTDKVNSEIPSPVAGRVQQILAKPDEELQVGEALAIISLSKGAPKGSDTIFSQEKIQAPKANADTDAMKDYYSPAVLRSASEKGIGMEELQKVAATGAGGRVTKQDIEAYAEQKKQPPRPSLAIPQESPVANCPYKAASFQGEDIDRLKMTGMRKAIADNMVKSFYEAPHATLVNEVDVTAILKLVQQHKEEFFAKHGFKVTITSFVAKAISRALQEFPLINSSLDKDTILVKRFVNLGIAVSIDQGLIVPVIKNCQRMGITDIARSISELSQKARSSKLSAGDVEGGTISMTNFGMSGVAIGVPIIRYPEVAIVGIGAIQKRVVVLENDVMAIRSLMHVSLTFDHRVLDGMYGCGFLGAVKKHLEQDLKID